jgi:hypothetical protein
MVTHEDDIAACAKRVIKMRDGLIIDDSPSARMIARQAALVGTVPLNGAPDHWSADYSAGDPELRPSSEELAH